MNINIQTPPCPTSSNGNSDYEMLLTNVPSKSIINIPTCVGSHVLTQWRIMLHILAICNWRVYCP